MQSPKEVRSFRLDKGLLRMLEVSAGRHGINENALVEGILVRKMKIDPILLAFDYVCVERETFASLLGLTNADGLEVVGAERGKKAYSLARELFRSNDLELGFPQFVSEILGEGAHWFKTEGTHVKPERITLHHRYGIKWSGFLKAYISSAYDVLSRNKLEMTFASDYVTIRFPEARPR